MYLSSEGSAEGFHLQFLWKSNKKEKRSCLLAYCGFNEFVLRDDISMMLLMCIGYLNDNEMLRKSHPL